MAEQAELPGFETAAELARRRGLAVPTSAEIAAPGAIPKERLDVIRRLFQSGKEPLDDHDIAYVMSEAFRTKLDPIRQLAAWKDPVTKRVVVHTRIDGLLALAERTGKYRGCAPTFLTWLAGDKTVIAPMRDGVPPGESVSLVAATCAVYREGYQGPVEVTRYWADCAPKNPSEGSAWVRQGAIMLEKCALAAALRRAFPQDLAGLYESAEIPRSE